MKEVLISCNKSGNNGCIRYVHGYEYYMFCAKVFLYAFVSELNNSNYLLRRIKAQVQIWLFCNDPQGLRKTIYSVPILLFNTISLIGFSNKSSQKSMITRCQHYASEIRIVIRIILILMQPVWSFAFHFLWTFKQSFKKILLDKTIM